MSTALPREQWPFYLDSFCKHNQGRPTELKIFDYLEVEHCLPLNGIYLEEAGQEAPKIEILLGGAAGATPHITHQITRVRSLVPLAEGGRYAGLVIEADTGIKTTLSFTAPQQLIAAS
jgi:hypothetical protein